MRGAGGAVADDQGSGAAAGGGGPEAEFQGARYSRSERDARQVSGQEEMVRSGAGAESPASSPASVMPRRDCGAFPILWTTTACVPLLVPTGWLPKLSAAGFSRTIEPTPLP